MDNQKNPIQAKELSQEEVARLIQLNKKFRLTPEELEERNKLMARDKGRPKMPWYYWFAGLVVFSVIMTTTNQLSGLISALKLDAMGSAAAVAGLAALLLYILAFWLPSLIWKSQLKRKGK